MQDAIIIGAGLAGLCCANRLHEEGLSFTVLEASDAVGGRIRTDEQDGFLLDRGFQVFSSAYPEAQIVLDYENLQLKMFKPGSLVWDGIRFNRVTDIWRIGLDGIETVLSPFLPFMDKIRMELLRQKVLEGSLEELFSKPNEATIHHLKRTYHFSETAIERFFRPFLSGVFLDPQLYTSSRMFEFVFRNFALGYASLPSGGMQRIPQQLADRLPTGSIRLNTKATKVEEKTVTLASGETLQAKNIIIATDWHEKNPLITDIPPVKYHSVSCLYYSAPTCPVDEPILLLNCKQNRTINNLCFPSRINPTYAPAGKTLVSVSVLEGVDKKDEETLHKDVLRELEDMFGKQTHAWEPLKTYHIQHALPIQWYPALDTPQQEVKVRDGLFLCGDHRDNASINGAMVSGRRAAEKVLEERS